MNDRDIFIAARHIAAAEERKAFLDKTCDADARRRVEELLLADEQAGGFLDRPCVDRPETVTARISDDSTDQQSTGDGTDPNDRPIALDFLSAAEAPGTLGRIGPYDVTEVIGQGGMGIVLKARDGRLNRVVAVKVLAPALAGNAMARRRFVREAQAVAAVAHPHIVAIHAVDEDKLPYLVMEFIDGLSLQEKIDREGHLELREILRIGAQIAAGLASAHAQGVIHRDIKPANILLENGVERVRITDFGLARAVDDVAMTRTGEVTGTPQYMSPEQSQGRSVDARSDLFSLGSVLYAMCTGRSPFRADTTMACLRRVSDDAPRPIREVNPDIPGWLVAIIDRLLEKDPSDRIQSAAEVSELLGKHLAHSQDPQSTPFPGTVCPVSRTAATVIRWRRRGLVAALVLVALAAGFGVTEGTGITELATTVVRIVTGEGTLAIEVDDPTVRVSLDGEELSITGAGLNEIRLRPGQYQFEAVKNGAPVKRELVTITRGDKQVVRVQLEREAPPPAAVIQEPGAFVVLGGKGIAEREFDTLAEAVLSTGDGDTIEVRGNGPFVSDGVTVPHPLVIRAGEGYTPSITLSQASAEKNTPLLSASDSLVLEGLELRRNGDAVDPFSQVLRALNGQALHVANCRLILSADSNVGASGVLIGAKVAALTLRNCELMGDAGTAPWWDIAAGGRCNIENCVSTIGGVSLGFREPDAMDISIRVRGNTFVGNCLNLTLWSKPNLREIGEAPPPIRLDFSRNVTRWDATRQTGVLYFHQYKLAAPFSEAEAEAHLPHLVRLEEQQNVYLSGTRLLRLAVDWKHLEGSRGHGLIDWNRLWNQSDTGSVEGNVRFHGGDLLRRAETSRETLTPEDFRLRADSAGYRAGPHGRDLGADVELVGPGPAYERWKATPEYQQWLADSGQAPDDVGLAEHDVSVVLASDDWVWTAPMNLGAPVNSKHGEFHPFTSADGLTLIFCSDRPGGQGMTDLWQSTRPSIDEPWGSPVNLGTDINSPSMEGNSLLSADCLTLFVDSDRPGGQGGWDIWMHRRATINDPWSEAINLGPPINTSWGDGAPSLSSDGLVLLFHSNRPGGEGGNDLWMSHRSTVTAGWSQPIPLGAAVNTQDDESGPRLSSDGRLLLFNSDRPGGKGHQDLWISRGASAFGPWSKAVNLGPGLNAGGNDKHASFAVEERGLVFESGRPGSLGAHDLWMATRVPKIDHVRLANEHVAAGQMDEAANEFNLALSSLSDANQYGAERMRIVKQFALSDELFERIVQTRPADIKLWNDRGVCLAEASRWAEAAACFQKRLDLGPDGAGLWAAYAIVLLAKRDDDAYRKLCISMLSGFSSVSHSSELQFVACVCVFIPDAVEDNEQAMRMAEKAAAEAPPEHAGLCLRTYAAWQYRCGRLEKAIETFYRAAELENNGDYCDYRTCFLAMAHHRLGHADEARHWSRRVHDWKSGFNQATEFWLRVPTERLMAEMDAVLAREPDKARAPQADDASELPHRHDTAKESP